MDSFEEIYSNGDVVLVVGPQAARLRVHSQCLSSASKVFRAMFGPTWSEGKDLSGDSPKEIPLPEDDPSALYAICCVVHHRNDLLPQAFSPEDVLKIAIEADKYDLFTALKYARTQWLQQRESNDVIEIASLMTAALLFDDMDMFVAHGLALILHYNGSYVRILENSTICQILPDNTIYLLEERRNRMRAEMADLIIQEMRGGCSCGWGKNRQDRYRELLVNHYSPLRILEVPLSDVIRGIKNTSYEGIERKYHSEAYGKSYYHEPSEYIKELAEKVEAAKRRASICLDCLRNIGEAGSCRFKHG